MQASLKSRSANHLMCDLATSIVGQIAAASRAPAIGVGHLSSSRRVQVVVDCSPGREGYSVYSTCATLRLPSGVRGDWFPCVWLRFALTPGSCCVVATHRGRGGCKWVGGSDLIEQQRDGWRVRAQHGIHLPSLSPSPSSPSRPSSSPICLPDPFCFCLTCPTPTESFLLLFYLVWSRCVAPTSSRSSTFLPPLPRHHGGLYPSR